MGERVVKVVVRYLGGDVSLVAEIMANSEAQSQMAPDNPAGSSPHYGSEILHRLGETYPEVSGICGHFKFRGVISGNEHRYRTEVTTESIDLREMITEAVSEVRLSLL